MPFFPLHFSALRIALPKLIHASLYFCDIITTASLLLCAGRSAAFAFFHFPNSPSIENPGTIEISRKFRPLQVEVENDPTYSAELTASNLYSMALPGFERKDLAWGQSRGTSTSKRATAARPSQRKGKSSKRHEFVKNIVREVAGNAPYERRLMELLR